METTPIRRRWVTAAGFVAATVVLLGCGVISQVRQVVDTATLLGELAELMENAEGRTYTAEYESLGGGRVLLAQDPPNAAWRAGPQVLIFTQEHLIICEESHCQRSPNEHQDPRAAEAGLIGGMMGPGLVTPEMALGMIAMAMFVPGAKVNSNEETIAGQKSRCADVTGLDEAEGSGPDSLSEFTVCVTEQGILSRFSGVSVEGEHRSVELLSYADSVDPALFEPPAGVEMVDFD